MNIRKIIFLLEILTLSYVIYLLWYFPQTAIIKSIYVFAILTFIDLAMYSYEYFALLKPQKVFLIEPRFTTTFIFIILYLVCVGIILYKSDVYELNSILSFVFMSIITFRSGFYTKQRKSLRMDFERVFVANIFKKDIWFKEVKDVQFNMEKSKLLFGSFDGGQRTLRLERDFAEDNEEELNKVTEMINEIAQGRTINSRSY